MLIRKACIVHMLVDNKHVHNKTMYYYNIHNFHRSNLSCEATQGQWFLIFVNKNNCDVVYFEC